MAAQVHPELSSLLQGAATTARRVASTDRAVAALPVQRGHGIILSEQVGLGVPLPSRSLRALVRAVGAGGPIVVPDLATPESLPSLGAGFARVSSLAAVPLCPQSGGGCLLVTSETQRGFTTPQLDALAFVAAQTTQAISHLHEAKLLRDRVARELHDTVTQTLTLVTFSLDELLDATADDASRSLALIARSHTSEALRQLRRLIDHCSEPTDESVQQRIQRLLDELARKGIEVRINGALGDETLPDAVSDCLLNIAHEALMNVRRHAGARQVTVVLRRAHDAAWLEVTDDGRGFPGQLRSGDRPAGRGLSIMRERARLLGGMVTVRAHPAAGTSITARIPLPH